MKLGTGDWTKIDALVAQVSKFKLMSTERKFSMTYNAIEIQNVYFVKHT